MNRCFNVISIGLNFVLLGVFLFCVKANRVPDPPGSEPQSEVAHAAAILQKTNFIEVTNAPVPVTKFHWREIESEDYPTYMANLRAVNCPEKTIFDIIFADIEKLFAERKEQLEKQGNFWLAGDELEKVWFAKEEEIFQLQEEKHALIQTLLNSELDWEVLQDWYEEKELGIFVGFLSDSQAERALSVAKKFGERIERVDKRARGLLIPEDAEEKKKIYSEMKLALGGIVSSAELEEAELRLVCLISYLFSDNDLKEAKLTGSELRQIMQFKFRFDNPLERELIKYSGEGSASAELSKQNFLEQTKIFLGEARFQQFLRAHDEGFEQLFKLTEQNGLPLQTTMGVYEIQQIALLESSRIREDRTLRRKELRLELETLEQTTRDAVERLLGEKAAAYYSTNGGNWLKELKKP